MRVESAFIDYGARFGKVEQRRVATASMGQLVRGFPWRDVLLDLFGELAEDGYEVGDIALTGSEVSLMEWFSRADLAAMDDWCNANLPSTAELNDQARLDAYQDRAA